MFKPVSVMLLSLGVLVSGPAHGQSTPTLDGIWRAEDGSATVRVAKCSTGTNWCATVVAEQLKPGEPSQLNQMLVRDMRPNGTQGWTGQYVAGGRNMKASAKLLRSNTLAFKVCAFAFLCETMQLSRVRG
jgi:uncharacterized protein (DUF2147 family)